MARLINKRSYTTQHWDDDKKRWYTYIRGVTGKRWIHDDYDTDDPYVIIDGRKMSLRKMKFYL